MDTESDAETDVVPATTETSIARSVLVPMAAVAPHVAVGTSTLSFGTARVDAGGTLMAPLRSVELLQGIEPPRPHSAGVLYSARSLQPLARV